MPTRFERIDCLFKTLDEDYCTDGQLTLIESFCDQFCRRGDLSEKQLETLEDINYQAGMRGCLNDHRTFELTTKQMATIFCMEDRSEMTAIKNNVELRLAANGWHLDLFSTPLSRKYSYHTVIGPRRWVKVRKT